MKITYDVVTTEDEKALVVITPEVPINGFHGVTLGFKKNEDDGENWIEERVKWKVNQELGLTAKDIIVEKV